MARSYSQFQSLRAKEVLGSPDFTHRHQQPSASYYVLTNTLGLLHLSCPCKGTLPVLVMLALQATPGTRP
jgi:hypothetical protein